MPCPPHQPSTLQCPTLPMLAELGIAQKAVSLFVLSHVSHTHLYSQQGSRSEDDAMPELFLSCPLSLFSYLAPSSHHPGFLKETSQLHPDWALQERKRLSFPLFTRCCELWFLSFLQFTESCDSSGHGKEEKHSGLFQRLFLPIKKTRQQLFPPKKRKGSVQAHFQSFLSLTA